MFGKDSSCPSSSSDSERSSSVRRRSMINQGGPSLVFSAFRRSSRRMRREKRLTKEEYHRLKHMVPSVSAQSRVTKVQVIEEAIKYIDSLHLALFQRLKAQESEHADSRPSPGGRSEAMINDPELADPAVLRQWIERVMPVPSSAAMKLFQERQNRQQLRERCKQMPSFLEKVDRMSRKRPN